VEEDGAQRRRLRGWSVAWQLVDVAEPARGGWVSKAAAPALGAAARQGRAVGDCLHEEWSREEEKENWASTW
jgi:hypothetical protein